MRHLNSTLTNTEMFPKVSPLFQLMGSSRMSVVPLTLLAGLNAGWATTAGINEQDPVHRRSLLLTYLGTFPSYQFDRRPDATVTQDRLDAEALALRAIATHGDPVAVAQRLLDLGADPFLQDHDGRDALDQVLGLQWTPVLDRLLALDDPRVTPGALAERTQFAGWREYSQGAGKHPGITPAGDDGLELPWLHAAAAKGRLGVIEHLLDHGMDVNQRDAWGRTPLFYVPFDPLVQRLLERGADPTVRDTFGEMANAAWTRFGLGSDDLKAMNARFLAAYRADPRANPLALKDEQRSALFHQAVKGTANTFQAFLKGHGFSVDERMVQDGRDLSLLAHVAVHGLDSSRSPAIASLLVAQTKAGSAASLDGLPDVVLAWLFTHSVWQGNTDKARRNADHAMAMTYGWDQPGGFERCLDEVLFPLFERLLRPPAFTPQAVDADPDLAWFQQRTRRNNVRQGIVRTLERALDGSLGLPMHAQAALRHAGRRGTSRAWHWAAIAARHHGEMDGMSAVHNVVIAMVGGTQQLLFQIPPDADTAAALIGVLGQRGGLVPSFDSPRCEWGVGSLVSALHQVLMDQQIPLDTAQPGFPALLAALQKEQPLIAQAIERRTLEDTLTLSAGTDGLLAPGSAARGRERSRL